MKTIDPDQAFGIDITKKENHLIGKTLIVIGQNNRIHSRNYDLILESEFEPVFGMTRTAFDAMPKWKQDNKKKAVGLF